MKRDHLRKLGRTQLLTMLRDQELEIQELKAQNKELKRKLNEKRICIQESGSIAEAALKLTAIFEEAQKAVDLYRANCMTADTAVSGSTIGGTEGEEQTDLR